MPGLARLFSRSRQTKIEDIVLAGESIADYQAFWNESARTDAPNAVALGVDDFWSSGQAEAEMLRPFIEPDVCGDSGQCH